MVAPRTSNYRLNTAVILQVDKNNSKVLEAGSYVRPIDLQYVPDHVTDRWKYFSESSEVFAYTKFGIIPILKSSIEEI